MKVFLAVSLLIWAVAECHCVPGHNLEYPPFIPSKTHHYELWLNLTSSIPGLTSQIAKSTIWAKLVVQPKTDTEYLLKLENVKISEATPSVSRWEEDLPLKQVPKIESELTRPIKFTIQDGKVQSYTLHKTESAESKRIKRAVLRMFEFEFRDEPVYNVTKDTLYGPVNQWYTVNVSPFVEFPYEQHVFNISRNDFYDWTGYPAWHEHHNFAKQGCPEVCRLNKTNIYGAGCPHGYEPNASPVRLGSVTHWNLVLRHERMVLEEMLVEEEHVASMYDQDMVVGLSSSLKLWDVREETIEEPKYPEAEYTDLETEIEPEDLPLEVAPEVKYWAEFYPQLNSVDAARAFNQHIKEIVEIVVKGDLEDEETRLIGEKLILAQKTLRMIKKKEFSSIWKKVVDIARFRASPDEEKLRRQIVLDLLPLVGTEEAVEFIKYLIEKEKVSVWEAREILDTLPENLITKSTKAVLKHLLELLDVKLVKSNYMLRTSAHLAVARVISKSCVSLAARNATGPAVSPNDLPMLSIENEAYSHPRSLMSKMPWGILKARNQDLVQMAECPESTVRRYIKETAEKLVSARDMHEKVMYIETLAHIGSPEVLEYLAPYVNGTADDTQHFEEGDIDFLQTVTIYALHHVIGYYPHEVLKYVAPVYFNHTEVPRVRIAAFSAIIRCQPPMNLLKHVATDTWKEPSYEVGSYVYSTVKTYGNSTEPCMKLTAKKIKHVIAEFKSFDFGEHHAQTLIKTFFDKIRSFGLAYAHSFIPSNESFIPSALYSTATFNIDSLREDLWKLSLNIQGLPLETILEHIDTELFNIKWPESIPKNMEQNIFGAIKVLPRLPKHFRLTVYKKIFYCASYAYLDKKTLGDVLEPLRKHILTVFTSAPGEIRGQFAKVFIPASYHSFTIGRRIPLPIEFNMKHPLLVTMKLSSAGHSHSPIYVHYEMIPGVYYSTHYEKYVVNPIDKKAYGVYYEQKYAVVLPLRYYMHLNPRNNTIVWNFQYPQEPKRLLSYHSEAGTFAGEMEFSHLPSTVQRDTIKTIPTVFQKEKALKFPGLPTLYLVSHSEDISEWVKNVPRNLDEAIALGVELFRNPGWRFEEFNATLVQDSRRPIHNFLVQFSYNRTHNHLPEELSENRRLLEVLYPRESSKEVMTDPENKKVGLPVEEAKLVYRAVSELLSHVSHEFEYRFRTSPYVVEGLLRVEYNHTYDGLLHAAVANVTCASQRKGSPFKGSMTHIMRYRNIPSEFKYDQSLRGSQRADCFCSMNMQKHAMFEEPDFIARASMLYAPYRELFDESDFPTSPEDNWFTPETHEECIRDMNEGKSLTKDCLRAVRETTIFNRLKLRAELKKDLPAYLWNITSKVDQAIKYALYNNLDLNRVKVQNPESTLLVTADYVDRLTDVPILNVEVRTPRETAQYNNINAKWVIPMSGLYWAEENWYKYLTNNTYPVTCSVARTHVTTFDLKTFKLPSNKCTYLLSAHCSEKKHYAIFIREIGSSKREVDIYVGKDLITLKPTRGDSYSIEHNRRPLKINKHIMLNEETGVHTYLIPQVIKGQKKFVLALHAEKAGIRVHYDGTHIRFQVNPMYKGKLCGLCSEFDGEVTREFRGADRCLYWDSEDFVNSLAVNPKECGVSETPKAPVLCDYGEESGRHWEPSNQDSRVPSSDEPDMPKPKTIHMKHGEFICFSTKPVPTCPEDMRPARRETRSIEFHCLPESDSTTRRLIIESERRIIHEVENKSVDFVSTMAVPRSCDM